MTTEPGQVYLVDLGVAAKIRPMVVVSRRDEDAPRALSICAPITTACRESAYEVSVGKPRFLDQKSFVNLQGLQAIQNHELKKMIGCLSEEQMIEIRRALVWNLDLSEQK
jgi:mRNA interferase MazF